tara:strand:+ start:2056 stop:4455 length:2400 start_codon:yes stop_codon:yes gene_type:complete
MKIDFLKIIIVSFLFIFFGSCSITKNLDENDYILEKNKVSINNKLIQSDSLNSLIIQKQNKKFFGIPIQSLIYQTAKKNPDSIFNLWEKKKNMRKGLKKVLSEKQFIQLKNYYKNWNRWKSKNGEPIALIDSLKIIESLNNFRSFFQNIGFLENRIGFDLIKNVSKPNYASVKYNIKTGPQYYVGDVTLNTESDVIDSIFRNSKEDSFLKKNKIFQTSDFQNERNRINNLMKNNGIYNFQINSVFFDVEIDSTRDIYSLPVKIIIDGDHYKKHSVRKINYIDVKKNQEYLEKSFLTNQIEFGTDETFNDSLRFKTIQNLNNLDLYSFPSVGYEYVEGSEHELNANIFLNSKKKYGLGFGFDLKKSDIEDIGISFENRFKSRNIFKNGENLQLSAVGSIGKSNSVTISQVYFDATLRLPKFIFFRNLTKKFGSNSKSFISFGSTNQKNIGLDRTSFRFNLDYTWENKNNFFNFNLSELELINNRNISNYFNIYSNSYNQINEIAKNNTSNPKYFSEGNLSIPDGINNFINDALNGILSLSDSGDIQRINYIENRRDRLTSNNLIIGSTFTISNNYDNRYDKGNFKQWRFKIKTAGNLASLLVKENLNGFKTISDLKFSQFIKTELSYIKHWNISDNSLIAFRYFSGIAIPFGNSENIPFSESFFAGGSTDNRAWQVYRLGPGSSGASNEFNEANLKLALNFEYRFNILGRFNGALFTDFGNIWNVLDDTKDKRRTFENFEDLSEIAIGSGFGLRYDSGLFIFRLDMGLKTYNPAALKNRRWFKDFTLKKAVFNIGLNYPF